MTEKRGGWNYRVIRHTPEWLEICEVYYDAGGKPTGYALGHAPGGNDENDIRGEFDLMAKAFTRPTLDVSEFASPASPTPSAVDPLSASRTKRGTR